MTILAPSADQPDASIDVGAVLTAVLKRAVRIVFVTLLLCAITYTVLTFMPRLYESSAGLLIEPRTNSFTRATIDLTGTTFLIDEATVSSQIELIKSPETLRAAIEEAGLREVPEFSQAQTGPLALIGMGPVREVSEQKLIAAVADKLTVTQERNSRLISVAFRSEDPELAAEMANAIATAHLRLRAGQQISDTVDATAWLQDEIDSLRERVSTAERAVADFRVENDLFQGANNISLVDQQLSDFATQITAAAERRNAAESRAQLIRNLIDSGQSVSGVTDVQNSPVVQQLSQELARLQGERALQSASLLSNHPTIRALDAQIAEINQQISEEGLKVAQALEAQAQIEASLEQSLRDELARLKVTAGSATVEGVQLAELEREAAALRELLNAYLIRYSEAAARTDVDAAVPDVRLVSRAAPSSSPVSPKTSLILIAVFLASLVLQVGGVIFSELVSGRALTTPLTGRRKGDARAADPDTFDTPPADAAEFGEAQPKEPEKAENPLPIHNPQPRKSHLDVEVEALALAATTGSERIVVIASCDSTHDSIAFAERLSARIVGNGQSVAEIDAASEQQGLELGLTDLCAGEADFGDVVHRGLDERFAFVPWGQSAALSRDPELVATLVDALADIYEAVVIVSGKTGLASTLPLFGEVGAQCILLSEDAARADALANEIAQLGYTTVRTVSAAGLRSEVA